jgi:hypothetical protein
MIPNKNFKIHEHLCEIVMVKGKKWKSFCPCKGKFNKECNECDSCYHQIIVNFVDKEMTMIENILRIIENKEN